MPEWVRAIPVPDLIAFHDRIVFQFSPNSLLFPAHIGSFAKNFFLLFDCSKGFGRCFEQIMDFDDDVAMQKNATQFHKFLADLFVLIDIHTCPILNNICHIVYIPVIMKQIIRLFQYNVI